MAVINLLVSLICVLSVIDAGLISDSNSCSGVKLRFQNRAVAVSEFPTEPVDGSNLRICKADKRGRSCCTEAIEAKLISHTRQQLDTSLRETLTRLATLLETRAARFDDFFRKLLSKSKQDFHDMFKRTYGTIYLQNSYVFTDLFEELENYYAKGQTDLTETMDNFFIILYQRIFTVLNAAYNFDDKYLECVSNHMKELKPFGDVPHKLSAQVKRSFVATRTYGQALAVGVEVVREMLGIKASLECVSAATRMQHCDTCAGHTTLKACTNLCINTMKGCYAYHADLETEWNNYVESMDKVAERLIGPFNIEMVVEPINIKISDAIMNFQDRGPNISQRVFQGCGKPENRRRRDANNDDLFLDDGAQPGRQVELELEHYNFNVDKTGTDNVVVDVQDSVMLESLVKDIRQKVQETKYFWHHLPYQYCNNDDIVENPIKNDTCWNGTDVGRYLPDVVGDGLAAQIVNPSVKVERPNSALNEQIYKLKMISNKLKMAYNGMDVEWIDREETTIYGSGSGSGSGPDDEDDDDSSSGQGPIDSNNRNLPEEPSVIQPTRNNTENSQNPSSPPEDTNENNGSSRSQMSLTRVLFTYLFPIVVVWFGGCISDIL